MRLFRECDYSSTQDRRPHVEAEVEEIPDTHRRCGRGAQEAFGVQVPRVLDRVAYG